MNKIDALELEDDKIIEFIKDFSSKTKENYYFFLILYIDHKKFDIHYNFYEIQYTAKFNHLMESIEVENELEVNFDEETILKSKGV